MSTQNQLDFEGIEQMSLGQFTEKAYLDYSMYVILDRALPHIGDGLKPVQRRIVYAMSELGLGSGSKPKKSARTVGDVIGKFHPHGDSACYEAMVLMAQSFSYRYPLVDGQGNWGSTDDPKSFAAMRYTEARLTPYAAVLLSELGQGTTDWLPNFDGTLNEPALLPARLPNLLLNGTSGIAVGMSTDIPPHNLNEVVSALIRLLDKPSSTTSDLLEHIKAPDFPTGGELVTPSAEIRAVYETGHGTLRVRARWERDGSDIVVTELPHQVSGSKILEQIANQMRARKLPMVEDLRDESDHENPTRLVIVPRSNRVDREAVMSHLFATTDLERTLRVNMNVIGCDGRPAVRDLRTILREWLAYRTDTVRRRLAYRLARVEERLHVLDGLLVAYLNIDEVIAIIRQAEDPREELMQRFELTEVQADAILNLRLRHLARLEEVRIRGEQEELAQERSKLEKLLRGKAAMKRLIRTELLADAESFGDERRTQLVERAPAQALDENDLVASEPVSIILSERGWVRAAKGHEIDAGSLAYKSGDGFQAVAKGRSNQPAVFLDSTGRAYSLMAHTLPSARGQGEPLSGRFNPPDGAEFRGVLGGDADQRCLLATSAGYGFFAQISDLVSRNRAGKSVLKVPEGAGVLVPVECPKSLPLEKLSVAALSDTGRLLIFPATELPELARGKGNKILALPRPKGGDTPEFMCGVTVVGPKQSLVIDCGARHMTLKPRDLERYAGVRGRRGSVLPRGWRKVTGIRTG